MHDCGVDILSTNDLARHDMSSSSWINVLTCSGPKHRRIFRRHDASRLPRLSDSFRRVVALQPIQAFWKNGPAVFAAVESFTEDEAVIVPLNLSALAISWFASGQLPCSLSR